jgi:hypothetical protein
VCACLCVCVCACVRACVRACVCGSSAAGRQPLQHMRLRARLPRRCGPGARSLCRLRASSTGRAQPACCTSLAGARVPPWPSSRPQQPVVTRAQRAHHALLCASSGRALHAADTSLCACAAAIAVTRAPRNLLADVAYVRQADVLLGLHSDSLYNAFFMQRHSSVVEVRPRGAAGPAAAQHLKVGPWGEGGGGVLHGRACRDSASTHDRLRWVQLGREAHVELLCCDVCGVHAGGDGCGRRAAALVGAQHCGPSTQHTRAAGEPAAGPAQRLVRPQRPLPRWRAAPPRARRRCFCAERAADDSARAATLPTPAGRRCATCSCA